MAPWYLANGESSMVDELTAIQKIRQPRLVAASTSTGNSFSLTNGESRRFCVTKKTATRADSSALRISASRAQNPRRRRRAFCAIDCVVSVMKRSLVTVEAFFQFL